MTQQTVVSSGAKETLYEKTPIASGFLSAGRTSLGVNLIQHFWAAHMGLCGFLRNESLVVEVN